jgi:hypothetical protein
MNVVVAPQPIMTKRGADHVLSNVARMNFAMFRSVIRPGMLWGWWCADVARQLQRFYEEFAAGLRPKMALEAPPQHGKVVSDECPILTVAGWKRHGDLRAGDRIFHPSGFTTRVVATYQKMPTRVRVELTNGEAIYVHEGHLWTIFNRNKKKWETIETQQMLKRGERVGERHPLFTGQEGKRGCHYTFQLPLVSPLLGEEKPLPADPYMLGVWLGDAGGGSDFAGAQPSQPATAHGA